MLHLYVHRLSSTLNVFIYWYFALRIRKYLAVQWVLNIVRNNTVSLREMIEMLRHQHKETEKKSTLKNYHSKSQQVCLMKDGGLLATRGPGAAEEDCRVRQARARIIRTCHVRTVEVMK